MVPDVIRSPGEKCFVEMLRNLPLVVDPRPPTFFEVLDVVTAEPALRLFKASLGNRNGGI